VNTPRWSATTKRVVVLMFALLGLYLLSRTVEIVRPFIWAAIVGYILQPLVAQLERRGLPRNLAALTVFLTVVAFIIGIVRFVVPLAFAEIRDLQGALPTLIQTAQRSVADVTDNTLLDQLDEAIFQRAIPELIQGAPRMAVPFAAAIGHFLLEFLVFLIGTFFFLRDIPKLGGWFRGFIPPSQRAEMIPLLGQVSALLGRYIRGQLMLVAIMASATTIGLTLFGLPYSFVLGILTGLLETIPIVGPITAGAIAVLVALGHPNAFGWPQLVYAAAIAALYTVLRHAEDYFVIPLLIGRIVRLHPALVIFSLLAGGTAFGLLGVLLAVPVAATVRLVLMYVGAKLRDEDPFPRLEEELAASEDGAAATHEASRPAGLRS